MAKFVLVHGAWHGGWCWVRVADRLRRAGHFVATPTLTGLGDRAHLLNRNLNLDTHIADVVAVIEAEELQDVVLFGHSYGGCVITGVRTRQLSACAPSCIWMPSFPKTGKARETSSHRIEEPA